MTTQTALTAHLLRLSICEFIQFYICIKNILLFLLCISFSFMEQVAGEKEVWASLLKMLPPRSDPR